jgi:GT2 family glycosyltransferase
MIKVSIVIPTCQRTRDLERCLERLMPQTKAFRNCEVIVTDDGDVERTKIALAGKFPAVVWTQGPRLGPAANRNHGANTGRGLWIVFLDDDLQPCSGWLDAYMKATSEVQANVVLEGRIDNDRHDASLLWEAPLNTDGEISFYCSANFAVSRALFKRLDGFDERYLNGVYAEDVEFGARARALGAKFVFLRQAAALHPLRRRPNGLKLAKRWEGKLIFAFDQGAPVSRVACNLPWHALRVIQSRFRGQPLTAQNMKAAAIFAAEWLWLLWYMPGWLRKWSQAKRSPFWLECVARHGPAPKFGF